MLLANPRRLALETVAAALNPPPPISYLRWAEQNIVFDGGQFPGPYNRDAFPFWDEVLRALGPDDPARYVTLVASAQVGKTVLGEIFCLATLVQSRGSFLVVHPTIENALREAAYKSAKLRKPAGPEIEWPVGFESTPDGLASIITDCTPADAGAGRVAAT